MDSVSMALRGFRPWRQVVAPQFMCRARVRRGHVTHTFLSHGPQGTGASFTNIATASVTSYANRQCHILPYSLYGKQSLPSGFAQFSTHIALEPHECWVLGFLD